MVKLQLKVLAFIIFLLCLFPATGFAEKVLVIDPGHGGKFSGTCGFSGNRTGYCEKEAALAVSLRLRDILKNSDIKVQMTRDTDKHFASYLRNADGSTTGGDFEKRMEIANGFARGNNHNSLFISIHFNGSASSTFIRGIETYYYDGVNHFKPQWPHDPMQITYLPDNKRFADSVHRSLVNKLKTPDRKVRNDQSFYVIRNAQMPAALLEIGYMTNPDEERLIKTAAFQQQAAEAIAASVIDYFKVFEVYDANKKKLATYKKKEEALNHAKSLKQVVTVFDKDKQQVIFSNTTSYKVEHRTNGRLKEFFTKEEAIAFATNNAQTRVIAKDTNWTIWSNYLAKKYDVTASGTLVDSFYDYNEARHVANTKANAQIIRTSTGEILWTNQNGVTVNRALASNKLEGPNRYVTAVEISKSLYPNGFPEENVEKTVILATGQDAADALSAGPLSNVYGEAPILLTNAKQLTKETKEEITRLQTKKVIIIGGEMAISKEIEQELVSMQVEIERISGKNRYETNRLIVKRLGDVQGVFVASGTSFPDALSVAPIAAANGWAIVLTNGKTIGQDALQIMNGKRVVMVGGPVVVSEEVGKTITAYPHKSSLERLAGTNRYETLAAVLRAFKNELSSTHVLMTTGANFPDALASAPLAARNKAPLILVGGDKITPSIQAFLMEYADTNHVQNIAVIGGVVTDPAIVATTNAVR